MNGPNTQAAARRPAPRELTKILSDCRDLAIHRLLLSFSAMLDRIGDMLMERANRSDVRDDTQHFLAARSTMVAERANIMSEFETRLRAEVNNRIAGDATAKADFSQVDAANLTLIDTAAMDESVITGNITRVIENFCEEELQVLNRGMGHLLSRPELDTPANPLSPSAIVAAFADALRHVSMDDRTKFTILKELNQSSLGELNAIYADINRHLVNLRVVPAATRPGFINLDYVTNRARVRAKLSAKAAAKSSSAEVDVMALFKKMFAASAEGGAAPLMGRAMAGQRGAGMQGAPTGFPGGMPGMGGGMPGMPGAAGFPGGGMMPGAGGFPGGGMMPGGGGFPGGGMMPGGGGFPGGGMMPGAGGYPPAGMPGAGRYPAAGAPGVPGQPGGAPGGGNEDGYTAYWMLGVEPPDPSKQGVAGPGMPGGMPGMPGGHMVAPGMPRAPGRALDDFPRDAASGPQYVPQGPLAPTPSGYVPGTPIIATRELGESLSRLQAGETGFDLGGGAYVQMQGVPEGKRNVLRDLQDSPLAMRVNHLEAMTIELVAMLFDFVFETRDLPDAIKALLGRLQIPVLKAAMLDGAFFARKSHPSRLLVNALAEAGPGWSESMGHDDPLYRKIDEIVHRILNDFVDNLAIFEELLKDFERFLEQEEKAAQDTIKSTTEVINQRDRKEIAPVIASSEIERQIGGSELPNFLATFLRQRWPPVFEQLYLDGGEGSEPWSVALTTIGDLVWSVQPKRTAEDRRQLVDLLPSLLKRLSEAFDPASWPAEERDQFLENLVEAHAASVKPGALASIRLPTAAVAMQARVDAEEAKAAGDEEAAAKAEQLAVAMAPAEPLPPPSEPAAPPEDDPFLDIAQSLERGMWVEFEDDDGQLAFRKLAWVSPLRGTYLFCNRQGQKAMSMTAEELATLFRADHARLVEAEPLLDRAFTSMMAGLNERMASPAPS